MAEAGISTGALRLEAAVNAEHASLLACQAGDWSGYGLIVDRYSRIAWAAVDCVTPDKSEIPDLVQEVFIRAYEKLHTFRFDSAFSTWLYRLARNHAVSRLRCKGRRLQPTSLDAQREGTLPIHERVAGGIRPDRGYIQDARQQELSQMIAELDLPYREVINLYYAGEHSYEEIASILGVPLNTVKTRLRRARARLVDLAKQRGWHGA